MFKLSYSDIEQITCNYSVTVDSYLTLVLNYSTVVYQIARL